MQIHRYLKDQKEHFRQAAQTLRLWVLEVLAWWVESFGDRRSRLHYRRCLRHARAETRALIYLSMIARLHFDPPTPARQWWAPRPASVQRGFRFARRRMNLIRLFTRGVRLQTLDDIRRVLDDFDAVVIRGLERLPRGAATGAPVAVAPPAIAHVATTFGPDLAAADTS